MFLPKAGVAFTVGNKLLPEISQTPSTFLASCLSEGSKKTHCRKQQYAVFS